MGRYHSYINTALTILGSYNGDIPFSIFIKQFFAKEKKYGSRDRKQIAAVCYSYFRVGRALNKILSEENVLNAFFIINIEPSQLIDELKPGWSSYVNSPFEEKIQLLDAGFGINNIFPFSQELNELTNTRSFCRSFLHQPDLFIRIRPHHKKSVIEKISTCGIQHRFLHHDNAVQFPPATRIENIAETDREAVIQDYNSQQVLDYIQQPNAAVNIKEPSVWDCCAASGGKSILIYDLLNGKMQLTVSDIRQSIILNLQQRFKNAGIKKYHHFIADISSDIQKIPATGYDIIICDVPCTGSGTWSRTPEQLYFFDSSMIDEFSNRQKKIATNAVSHLNNNGLFFYITCSVFKKENEEVAEFIGQQKGMRLLEMKNLFGYDIKADSMFVAVFEKKLVL